MENKNKKKSILRFMPTVAFLAFIYLFGVLFIVMPKSDYSSTEKRALAEFPEFSLETLFSTDSTDQNGKFTSKFEDYVTDHFVGRNFWMGVNSYYNLYTGRNGSDGVYNSKDGYLINVPVEKSKSYVQNNMDSISKFSKNVDVPITMLVAPSTGYIMSDKLPWNHFEYHDDYYFSQIIDSCKQSGIDFVDLREEFKQEAENGTELYYKTDHHWTTEGAYTAYVQLCNHWGITPTSKESFEIDDYQNFYGTTYSTSGFWLSASDNIQIWNNTGDENSVNVEIIEGDESNTYHSMYFLNHLQEDDKYPVFLDGNHAVEKITNSNAESGKLLVIKDSFSHCFAPFTADNFSEVTLVDLRYYKKPISELVEKEKYDKILVLYGIDNFATDTNIPWLK